MRKACCFGICSLLVALTFSPTAALAAENDGEETFVVIKAGRVITLAGEEIIGGEVVLVDGKIRLVGKDLDYPKSATVIDARREVVMPGLIHPRTRWQLPSYTRAGIHADRTPAQEIYRDEIDFQSFIESGFTAACFYPAGTGIPGPGVVYRTAGKQQDQELGLAYLRVTMSSPGRDKKVLRDAVDKARKEIEKVEKARKEWEEKQKKAKEEAQKKEAEGKKEPPAPENKDEPDKDEKKEEPDKQRQDDKDEVKDNGADDKKDTPDKKDDAAKSEEKEPATFTPPKIDPAVKPIVDWIRDEKGPPLLYELSKASDLRHLDDVLTKASELPKTLMYLSGTYSPDYHHVVEDLGKREAVVLVAPRLGQLPYTIVRYNLPGELAVAGCTVALLPPSDSPAELKQLRTRLAELVRAGLSREDALKAVTLHAAKVVGLEERLGSIEKGKDADVIFLDGDPLGVETRVTRVMILGEVVWEAAEQP